MKDKKGMEVLSQKLKISELKEEPQRSYVGNISCIKSAGKNLYVCRNNSITKYLVEEKMGYSEDKSYILKYQKETRIDNNPILVEVDPVNKVLFVLHSGGRISILHEGVLELTGNKLEPGKSNSEIKLLNIDSKYSNKRFCVYRKDGTIDIYSYQHMKRDSVSYEAEYVRSVQIAPDDKFASQYKDFKDLSEVKMFDEYMVIFGKKTDESYQVIKLSKNTDRYIQDDRIVTEENNKFSHKGAPSVLPVQLYKCRANSTISNNLNLGSDIVYVRRSETTWAPFYVSEKQDYLDVQGGQQNVFDNVLDHEDEDDEEEEEEDIAISRPIEQEEEDIEEKKRSRFTRKRSRMISSFTRQITETEIIAEQSVTFKEISFGKNKSNVRGTAISFPFVAVVKSGSIEVGMVYGNEKAISTKNGDYDYDYNHIEGGENMFFLANANDVFALKLPSPEDVQTGLQRDALYFEVLHYFNRTFRHTERKERELVKTEQTLGYEAIKRSDFNTGFQFFLKARKNRIFRTDIRKVIYMFQNAQSAIDQGLLLMPTSLLKVTDVQDIQQLSSKEGNKHQIISSFKALYELKQFLKEVRKQFWEEIYQKFPKQAKNEIDLSLMYTKDSEEPYQMVAIDYALISLYSRSLESDMESYNEIERICKNQNMLAFVGDEIYRDFKKLLMDINCVRHCAIVTYSREGASKSLELLKSETKKSEIFQDKFDGIDDAINILSKLSGKEIIEESMRNYVSWVVTKAPNKSIKIFTKSESMVDDMNQYVNSILQFLEAFHVGIRLNFLFYVLYGENKDNTRNNEDSSKNLSQNKTSNEDILNEFNEENMNTLDNENNDDEDTKETVASMFIKYHIRNETESFHTQYAKLCINAILKLCPIKGDEDADLRTLAGEEQGLLGEYRRKLLFHLEMSDQYNRKEVLKTLKSENSYLYEEQVVVYRKEGKHKEALEILLCNLKDSKAAEKYCDETFEKVQHQREIQRERQFIQKDDEDDLIDGVSNYNRFFEIYIQVCLGRDPIQKDKILELLKRRAFDINPVKVLEMIPDNFLIADFTDFMIQSIQSTLHKSRNTLVKKQTAKKLRNDIVDYVTAEKERRAKIAEQQTRYKSQDNNDEEDINENLDEQAEYMNGNNTLMY